MLKVIYAALNSQHVTCAAVSQTITQWNISMIQEPRLTLSNSSVTGPWKRENWCSLLMVSDVTAVPPVS